MRKDLHLKSYQYMLWQFISLVEGYVFEVLVIILSILYAVQFWIKSSIILGRRGSMDINT